MIFRIEAFHVRLVTRGRFIHVLQKFACVTVTSQEGPMKKEELEVKMKDGSAKKGIVMVPENLMELAAVMPELDLYRAGLSSYLSKAKRIIASNGKPRRKLLTVNLNDLLPEQRALLIQSGLLK